MITAIALFLVSVSVLTGVAAWMGERGVRELGGPTRWVWLAAMAAAPLLLAVTLLMPERATGSLATAPVFAPVELPPLVIGNAGGWSFAFDDVLVALWIASSVGLAGLLLWTSVGLKRARKSWERTQVLGRSVYISNGRGPAVAGFLRPWIVLPKWALTLPERDLGLVVLHEEEHVRAGDSVLLGLALALVVATPWNLVSWWQLGRLRGAMEMDCDRRVLRHEPDRERYGQSLLSVAQRTSGPSLGLAAFTERPLSLERRIIAMTWKNSRWTPLKAGLLILLAMVVAVQACGVAIPLVDEKADMDEMNAAEMPTVEIPAPTSDPTTDPATLDREAEAAAGTVTRRVEPSEPDLTVAPPARERATPPAREPAPEANPNEPSFTPFTVAPSILNRSEVVAAMQAEYPPLLKDAGIGGTIRMYFFIDADGTVQDVRIDQSSGHPALDDAAVRVADVYRFSAALNRDQKVPVWVSFPITFQIR